MNRRQDVTITLVLNVDADGAALLPGWPGVSGPADDPSDLLPPIPGVELAAYAETERVIDLILEALPSVLSAEFVALVAAADPPYDPETLDF